MSPSPSARASSSVSALRVEMAMVSARPLPAGGAGDRRADQADADQGEFVEHQSFMPGAPKPLQTPRRRRASRSRGRSRCAARWACRSRPSRARSGPASASAANARRRPVPASANSTRTKLPWLSAHAHAGSSAVRAVSQSATWRCGRGAVAVNSVSRVAAAAGFLGRAALTLNGPRMRLTRVDDVVRPIHPADAQRGKAHLGEGADHDDVLGLAHERRCRSRSPGAVTYSA